MHKDQFTATGPASTGSGHSRTAFSNNPRSEQDPEDFTYGVNVQGKRCGVLGESVKESSGRESMDEGVGIYGFGENFGVMGNGNRGISGVCGLNDRGRSGVIGAAMRGGTGVVGLSLNSIGNPLQTFQTTPDPADGDGTGVLGSSGTGTGVSGSSGTGAGVYGRSNDGDGVVGQSDAKGKSGVHGFNTRQRGAAFGVVGNCDTPDGAGVGGDSGPGVGVRGHSAANDGVVGFSDANGKSGVFGFNSQKTGAAFGVVGACGAPDGAGVGGDSGPGVGVHGHSLRNNGIVGSSEASGKSGVFGENLAKPGLFGGPGELIPFGVTGKADHAAGIGVLGTSRDGTGISGQGGTYGGVLQGTRAPLRLVPSSNEGAPGSGRHEKGEFFVDSQGSLFFCVGSGNPGTWKRVRLADL